MEKIIQQSVKDELRESLEKHLKYTLARDTITATNRDWWLVTCCAVRDQILKRFIDTQKIHHESNARRVYYFSLEYLMGRLLNNNLYNLNLKEPLCEALAELGLDYEAIRQEEVDMGLGNGGLGRLAACFLDSLATLDYPAIGYGIQYEFGLFHQAVIDGKQEEFPDNWLKFGNPWRILRPEQSQKVQLYGRVIQTYDNRGDAKPQWIETNNILGIPWDVPVVGYGGRTVNFLRLWESRASEEFDLRVFNEGGYVEAVREKALGETISKVLYPNDKTESGKELRLVQQYFFVACSLQDILRRFKAHNKSFDNFYEKVVIQLNDTHPAISIPELMRIFIDQEGLSWEQAWSICRKTFAYTNHTLLPEALEKWSVPLMGKVLPRHLQIIYEINHWFLENEVEVKWPGDGLKKQALSIIEEGNPQYIRMAYLSIVGSFSVNGVAKLHTELLKTRLLANFYELYAGKFNNKTNGVTPRRWLKAANPKLSQLISKHIGDTWITNLDELKKLEPFAKEEQFQKTFMAVKKANKEDLAELIFKTCHVRVNPEALFDVQIKRLHEYKRQHLNLLHILKCYRKLLHEPQSQQVPRVVIFSGKAAPGYRVAKEIIHAINIAAEHINNDKRICDQLKVIFLPNYNITLATKIIPAADLSEQISTAGKEASGTGNMKLGLNGACTIGTLDGANVEMLEAVGKENIFIFGHTVEEIEAIKENGYRPFSIYESNKELKVLLDWMQSSFFEQKGHNPMKAIRHSLLEGGDPFFVLADFESYCETQKRVENAYNDRTKWAEMAILNTARLGYFSSDRTIREYVTDIWKIQPFSL